MKHLSLDQSATQKDETASVGGNCGSGEFFAVDYRAWQQACNLGLNSAVTYLVLARGSLRDNRTTSWSVHATEERTGISRPKAKIAIEKLEACGLLERLDSSSTRPKRRIVPGHSLPVNSSADPRLPTTTAELVSNLPIEASALNQEQIAALDEPTNLGMVRYDGWHYHHIDPSAEKPDWIWLPNTLVDGAAGETPPVENLRQNQNVALLRLLVDLYHVHSLTFSAGVPPSLFGVNYAADEIAHQREFRVWDVWETETYLCPHAPFFQSFLRSANGDPDLAAHDFWEAISILRSLKYLDFTCHLFEGDGVDAEVIHPFEYGWNKDTTKAEDDLYWEAHRAAVALLPTHLRVEHIDDAIVPVYAHIPNVTAKGIARLRYRPKTLVTSQWFALGRKWERWTSLYSSLVAELPKVEPF